MPRKVKAPVVDIIGRPHIEDNGTQENTGGEHRPDFKAHRRRHAAKGVQPWAVARLSVTRLDENKSPAVMGQPSPARPSAAPTSGTSPS
jgi:hypothetical protein